MNPIRHRVERGYQLLAGTDYIHRLHALDFGKIKMTDPNSCLLGSLYREGDQTIVYSGRGRVPGYHKVRDVLFKERTNKALAAAQHGFSVWWEDYRDLGEYHEMAGRLVSVWEHVVYQKT